MRSLHIIAIGVAAVGFLLTLGLVVALSVWAPPRPRPGLPDQPDQGLAGMRFPEFALVDQDGASQTHAMLEGGYTIVDFVFTNCPLACPGMTGRMADLQDALEGTGVRFASMSLDPAHDTPAVLKEYAAHFGADHSTWSFLTGEPGVVAGIVRDGLRFELREDPETPITLRDGSKMLNIIHPVRFVLVGPRRELLGMYTYSDAEQMAMLERRARALGGR